ncbi:hypothetical protein LTR22_027554 [Elasticomyces elasticus]|nr:hypothetical protein LTR22_027554 [Elasticomyces elasticus]
MERVKAHSRYSTGDVAPRYQHSHRPGCKVPDKSQQLEEGINPEDQEVSDTDTSYNDASSDNDEHDDSSEDDGHIANRPVPNNKRQRVDDEDEDKLNSIIAKRDGLKVEVILSHLVEESGVKKYLVKWVGYSWVLEHELLDNDSRVLEGYICQQRSLRPRMSKRQRMAES